MFVLVYNSTVFMLYVRDLHGPGGPAGRARTGRVKAGRAHKPTKWNGPGFLSQRAGLHGPIRANLVNFKTFFR